MTRTILHVDMDAFFAAVEQRERPELRGKPVVVGAPPDRRGVVSAASYEARVFGIHSAMPSREAGRRCPHAVFLPVNGKLYSEVSQQIREIFYRFTPLVEPLSIDEAFLDVTGALRLFGPGPEIARKIKQAIRDETRLTASVGVAANKFLAKLASDLEKPDGLTVVPSTRAEILAFLAPLPVGRIWGVGKVTGEELAKAGIKTIGQLQTASEVRLAALLGPHAARHLLRLAVGEDERELETEHDEKSISREHTFDRDCTSPAEIRRILAGLADEVGQSLREAGKYAGLARLKLRWQGFETITRQRPFEHAICDDFNLRAMAAALLAAEELVKPVRLIGFGVSRLAEHAPRQLSLFGAEDRADDRKERLSRTVDALHQKFGKDSIRRAGEE
jgi:DNA polymerase IV